MQAMVDFITWFIEEFPSFLMSEPVIYFIGIIILGYLIHILFSLKRRF